MDFLNEARAAGIELRSWREGNHKALCPKCSAGRRNKADQCLSVTIEADRVRWKCHHCPWTGGAGGDMPGPRQDFAASRPQPRRYDRPKQEANPERPPATLEWFAKRGISAATVERMGVYRTVQWFPQTQTEMPCIAFPYEWAGQLRNVKYRSAEKHFRQEKNPEPVLYNADAIEAAAGRDLIFVEGEMDVLAMVEAGLCNVVSLPNGAPDRPETSDKRYEPLATHAEGLEKIRRFFIATDMDGPGEFLANELARRLGKDRCWRVTFPNANDVQVKDANECLLDHGAEVLRECLAIAKPWPIDGLYDADTFTGDILDMYHGRGPQPLSTGLGPDMDQAFKVLPGQFVVVTGIPNHGKALALDTPIPTPSGWTTMGDLKVGDTVFDETGMPCSVVRATEVQLQRRCYAVTFNDGTRIVADADHRWLTTSEAARRSDYHAKRRPAELRCRGTRQTEKRTFPSVVTTEEIGRTLISQGKVNHQIAVAGAIVCPEQDLPIPPYVLGIWLGDGHSNSGEWTCFDQPLIDAVRSEGFEVSPQATAGRYCIIGLRTLLRCNNLLGNKHIPEVYKRGSYEQRVALLQGLMDTDGSAGGIRSRACEFCTTRRNLFDDVYELVCSLGIKGRRVVDRSKLGDKDCGPRYRIIFTTHISAFRLERKLARQLPGKVHRTPARAIVAVEPVESVSVRCIEVDSESHLFLCSESFIPTHNSRWLDQVAVSMAQMHGWPWVIFSPETGSANHIIDLCEIHAGRPFHDGPNPRMSERELQEAQGWVREHFAFIDAADHTPSIDWVLERARAAVLRHGIRALIIDPYNELEAGRPDRMTETEFVSQLISKCKRFAKVHDVTVFMVAHPTKLSRPPGATKDPAPGLYDIAGSSHWRNKADAGLVVYRDFEEGCTFVSAAKIRRQPVCGTPGSVKFYFLPVDRRFSADAGSFVRA